MTDRFRTSDGVELFVSESGPAEAPVTVLLLHGWTEDHTVWAPVIAALGGHARAVALDFRGHGASDAAPRGSGTIARLADDVAELVAERIPAGRLVLVGHSMGGMTMMALAEQHPDLVRDRVAGAMFVSTSSAEMDDVLSRLPFPLNVAASLRKRQVLARRKRSASSPPSRRNGSPGSGRGALPVRDERLAGRILRKVAFGAMADPTHVRALVEQVDRAHRRSVAELNQSITEHNRTHVLEAFQGVPTLVVVGDRDRITPPSHSAAIAAGLPDAEHVVLERAGHTLPYERTASLVRMLDGLILAAS